jgi:hypothetical protein
LKGDFHLKNDCRFEFPVRQRISINNPGDVFECAGKRQGDQQIQRDLFPMHVSSNV